MFSQHLAVFWKWAPLDITLDLSSNGPYIDYLADMAIAGVAKNPRVGPSVARAQLATRWGRGEDGDPHRARF